MLSKLLSLFKTYDTVSVRGATTVNKDTKDEIEIKTNKLLQNIFSSNNIKKIKDLIWNNGLNNFAAPVPIPSNNRRKPVPYSPIAVPPPPIALAVPAARAGSINADIANAPTNPTINHLVMLTIYERLTMTN